MSIEYLRGKSEVFLILLLFRPQLQELKVLFYILDSFRVDLIYQFPHLVIAYKCVLTICSQIKIFVGVELGQRAF